MPSKKKKVSLSLRQWTFIEQQLELPINVHRSVNDLIREIFYLGIKAKTIIVDTPPDEELKQTMLFFPTYLNEELQEERLNIRVLNVTLANRIIFDRGIKIKEILNQKVEQTIEEYS